MAVLRWKHGKSEAGAQALLQEELAKAGYANQVRWNGPDFSASVGFGAVLTLQGLVNDQEVVFEKCSGAAGPTALAKIREILEKLFPGGNAP